MEGPDATSNGRSRDSSLGEDLDGDDQVDSTLATLTRQQEQPPAPAKPKLKRSTKIGLAIVGIVTLIEALAFGGTYYFYTRHYVSTDNAQVDGDKVDINAPATGVLTDWEISEGSRVRKQQITGRVRMLGSGAQPERPIKSPGAGVVAVNNAVNGQWVNAGTTLATAYDFNRIYVTARVEDTEIDEVHPGALVTIDVDAYPGQPVTGIVDVVSSAAASTNTIYPSPDTDPTNPQKVDQYIPVKISLAVTNGHILRPGMDVTVHINKG
jgi:multidrug resistance efflux pump